MPHTTQIEHQPRFRSTRYARSTAVAFATLAVGAGIAIPSAAAATAPPGVVTGAVKSVSPHSAVVAGTVSSHGLATIWFVEYGPNTTFTAQTPAISAGSGTSIIAVAKTIPGLAPATSYDYRFVARNAAGTTFGAAGSFNTSSPPTVVTGTVSNITAHTATLSGSVNPEARYTSWYFAYGKTPHLDARTAVHHLVASPDTSNIALTLSSLTAQSTYYFRLVASNSAGTTAGSIYSFSTGQSVTINTTLSIVVYGGGVTLSGAITNGAVAAPVVVESELFNEVTFTPIATLASGAGGAWSYTVYPSARTTYEAVADGGTSSAVTVSVSPSVQLIPKSRGRLMTQVTAAVSFGEHVLQLQILSQGQWATWKYVRLNANGEATFTTRLPKAVSIVRMAIAPFVPGIDQAAPGYLAGYSRQIRH
jgi:hypothetical protein